MINSIQQAVSAELDFQSIVDAVGDKLTEVLRGMDLAIWWLDESRNDMFNLYGYYRGKRSTVAHREPMVPGQAPHAVLIRGDTVVAGNWEEQAAAGIGVVPSTPRSLSVAAVPITGGQRVMGMIAIEDFEREHAFDAATVRLVQTVASSMGVALLNAKSYEAERQRCAAELAIINAVQRALAGELTLQRVYDIVGDKLGEVFPRSWVGIRTYDPATGPSTIRTICSTAGATSTPRSRSTTKASDRTSCAPARPSSSTRTWPPRSSSIGHGR